MAALPEAFHKVLTENRLVRPGDRVLVALSGGADSVALLHLFREFAGSLQITLRAAHLDHAIRPESARDATFAVNLCQGLGIPLTVERIDVPAWAGKRKVGLEEAARDVRREFLQRVAEQGNCRHIALGHHQGDQAETFLHRLLRGSGGAGLAAMALQNGRFIRPLLPFTREEIRGLISERGLPHLEDASNVDPAYTRNRIRHELLPLMATFNPRIGEHLDRLSRRLGVEEDFWRIEVEAKWAELGRCGEGEVRLDRPRLLALHPALRARVIRRALQEVRGDLRRIAACHIEGIENLLTGRSQAEMHLPGAWAGRRYESLWLRRSPPPAQGGFAFQAEGPGIFLLPDGRELRLSLTEDPQGESSETVEFDASGGIFPLTIRSFRPGDRFRPSGMAGTKKLKDFFIDAKVAREVRDSLPLLVGPEVLWVVGMRRCEGWRPGERPGPVLRAAVTYRDQPTIGL